MRVPQGPDRHAGQAGGLQHLPLEGDEGVERRAVPLAGHDEVLGPDRAVPDADQPRSVRTHVGPAVLAGAAVSLGAREVDPRRSSER